MERSLKHMPVTLKKYFSASSPSVFGHYYLSPVSPINPKLSSSAVFLFAVFASVDLILLIRQHEYMIQPLLDRCDTSRILAADHVADFFWEFQLFLLNDLFIFNDVDRDVVIDESEDVQIHEVDGAFDLDNIFFTHFIAFCVLDNGNTAVQFVKMQIFVDIHAPACFDMVEHKTF